MKKECEDYYIEYSYLINRSKYTKKPRIKIDRDFVSVLEILEKYKKNKIIIDDYNIEPWNINYKSQLIESILLGIPIPSIYLLQDKNANYLVLDGKNRLKAIVEYLENKFKLTNLSLFPEIEGKKFDELDNLYKYLLENYDFIIYTIKPPTPQKVKFHILERVNRGGIIYNNQEVRNVIYRGKSTKILEKISKLKDFREIIKLPNISYRLQDQYIILRCISIYLFKQKEIKYKEDEDYDNFLNKTMNKLNRLDSESLKKLEDFFIKTLKNINKIKDYIEEFYLDKENKKINIDIFEILFYIIGHVNINKENIQIIKNEIKFLSNKIKLLNKFNIIKKKYDYYYHTLNQRLKEAEMIIKKINNYTKKYYFF